MSLLVTVLLAWTALHVYVGTYYGLLHLHNRRRGEYGAFALHSFVLGAYTCGAALVADAGTMAELAHAEELQFAGGILIPATFAEFTFQLVGRKRDPIVWSTFGFAALGFIATVSGLLFDPGHAVMLDATRSIFPRSAIGSTMQLSGLLFMGGAIVLACYPLSVLASRANNDFDSRILLAAGMCSVLAGLHDLAVRVTETSASYLMEHAFVLTSLAAGGMLLRRFNRVRDELTVRTAELRESHDEVSRMQKQLVRNEQLAAVGELSAVIAHELQNPLSLLKDAVHRLREPKAVDEDPGAPLTTLDAETDRLNRLVNDLLIYARPVAPQQEAVSLEGLVNEAIETVRQRNPFSPDVRLDVSLGNTSQPVHGDPDLLRRAVANIVENAMQAMPSGGELRVRAHSFEKDDGSPAVQVDFHDTGEGMDTLVRSKARDPFFTTRPSGTGFGLAIVERVVRAHGGSITLHSRASGGTTVSVMLPARRPKTSRFSDAGT